MHPFCKLALTLNWATLQLAGSLPLGWADSPPLPLVERVQVAVEQARSMIEAAIQPQTEPVARAPLPGEDVRIGDPNIHYYDHEIWQDDGLVCWQDNADLVWIAEIDPQSGLLIPSDGRGHLVGKAGRFEPKFTWLDLLIGSRPSTANGPEWGISQAGLGLYFSIVDNDGVLQLARYRLNTRQIEPLTSGGTLDRRSMSPTSNGSDPECRIVYFEGPPVPTPTPFARFESDATAVTPVPLDALKSSGIRWIPGEPAIVTNVSPDNATLQVARFDVDSQQTTLLTTGPENHSDPFVEIAPDRNGNQVLACLEGRDRIAIFENVSGTWTKTAAIPPAIQLDPPEDMVVFGTELVVHRGRTYVFYAVTTKRAFKYPSYICVASIDGSFNTVVSNRTPVIRLDPEGYSGSDGLFIYYFTKQESARHLRLCRVKLPDDE